MRVRISDLIGQHAMVAVPGERIAEILDAEFDSTTAAGYRGFVRLVAVEAIAMSGGFVSEAWDILS